MTVRTHHDVTGGVTDLAALSGGTAPARLEQILARPGTRAVLLGGSRDPNAKATVLLFDPFGPAFTVTIPTTRRAVRSVAAEAMLLDALDRTRWGGFAATVPSVVGRLTAGGMPALVTTALPGRPMTVRYHVFGHTVRRRAVHADFTAAAGWLTELHRCTAGNRTSVDLLSRCLPPLAYRFAGEPATTDLMIPLSGIADRLAAAHTPRTVVHGDFRFGNILRTGPVVSGVIGWESGEPDGEPLRDVVRFALSYALYLDRHTVVGRRIRGHRGLRATEFGARISCVADGNGWFPDLVRDYLRAALSRLGAPPGLWRDVLLAGLAEMAATAADDGVARQHLDLLCRLCGVPRSCPRPPARQPTLPC